MLARVRPHIDDPVRLPDHVEIMLDHEQRITRRLQAVQRAQQRFGVGRMQAGRRLVEHIHHAKQIRAHLRGQAQPLQLARRQGGRAAVQAQVAETQVQQHLEPAGQVLRDALGDDGFFGMRAAVAYFRLASHIRREQCRQFCQAKARHLGNIEAGKLHRQRFAPQPLAFAHGAVGAQHVLRHALFHLRAGAVGKGLQHVFARARKRAHIARRHLRLQRRLCFLRIQPRIHGNLRLLVGKQYPVAHLLRQVAPRRIDVVAQRGQDIAQVLAMPGRRPGGDRALADGEAVVRHHRRFRDGVDAAQAVAFGAGALGGVGRKRFRVQQRLVLRIVAGARIQHAQQIGHRGDAAHRRTRGGRAALLLQGHGRRQAVDAVDFRHRHLVKQAPRIRRDGFQITPLRFRIQRAKGQRGLAGARYARKYHQRIARNIDVDIFQIVFARAAHADVAGQGSIGNRSSRHETGLVMVKEQSGSGTRACRLHRAHYRICHSFKGEP